MSILITGAAGFIGSHLTERFLSNGASVVGLDSFDDFYDPLLKERNLERAREHDSFLEVRGDVRDRDALAALPDGIDAVLHLAARAGVRPSLEQPLLYQDVNVAGTLELLECARTRSIDTFVLASSSSVYGNSPEMPLSEDARVDEPISVYAATKKAAELLGYTYHSLYGMTVVCLRFFTVYGPRQRPDLAIHKFARLMSAGEPIAMFGDGSTARDYTFVDDIVDGVDGALSWAKARAAGGEPAYEIVNLGESRTIALSEMIDALAHELNVHPQIERRPKQPGDVDLTCADIRKARELFGYDPRWEFRPGLQRFIAWLRAQD